ncbi:uncharacterized protein LOC105211693 isoform X2 [Zeugodacus cucurbitae]|uniref:uncharacterized protein LOC105211693 isoform X2 n=1 Tax=Zeugodacus cucurbitae TaxID=28588 RepID=UPI0023D8F896|nr:uncharacterized protein LOC105211693 isoform X2 [Zeugodacus cucurbitae]
MNWERVLGITNAFLVLTGFQLHSFESKTQRYHISLWSLVNFVVLTLFYIVCINQHFMHSPLLKIFYDVSPFFWQLIRAHLMLGVKIYIFRLFSMAAVGRACNGISSVCNRVFAHKFSLEEVFAYFLVYSTFGISLCFAAYIAYEMEFKLPPWDNIFISFGLFIPHFALAGALKLYTLNCWLLREELRQLKVGLQDMLMEHLTTDVKIVENGIEMTASVSTTNACVKMPANNLQKELAQYHERFEEVAAEVELVSGALNKEMLLLLVMNSTCLLAGVYSLVYFQTSWHLFFSPPWKRIFYASNIAIYVLISWDYICLCTSVWLLNKVKNQILDVVQVAIKSKTRFEKAARTLLKDIRNVLSIELRLTLFNLAEVNAWSLIMVHVVVGLIISLVVVYQYLNDQIVLIQAQLDTDDGDY